ncbi:MAG: O-antigen ligase family protein [Prevotella sp.]|nr:O-antigen ligase family protein [Prevotella sp.]
MFYLTCVAATIDTRHFVYPSLSRSLLMEVGLLLCGSAICLRIMAGCVCRNRGNCIIGVHEDYGCRYFRLFIFAWIAYILFHGMLSPVVEWYRTTYLCVTLLSIIVFSYGLRCGILTRRLIVNGLLMIAAAHVIAIFAQWLGILEPEDAMYPVTGFNDNPNVTAMYLAGCVPFIVQRVAYSDRRSAYVVFLTLLLISVIMLRCRTAYIGLAVETAVLLLAVRRARQALCSYKWLSITIAAVLLSVSAVRMYDMKRDSAAGRKLIWHLSAQMICERPLGHGYGLFEKHYNQHQAAYFAAGGGTETERRTATYVGMAYNDYLEHGVDGGIIGMLFLAGFYVLAIRMSVRRKDRPATATLSAFAVMSMTNFVTASIQPWLMAVCLASMSLTDGEHLDADRKTPDGKSLQHLLPLLAIICTGLFIVARMTLSQVELKHLEDRIKSGRRIPDAEFAGLENRIYSSEAYWRTRFANNIRNGDHAAAIVSAGKGLMLTSNPSLLLMQSSCLLQQKDTAGAVKNLEDACHMQPSLLYPKLYLMRLHTANGDTAMALRRAGEIISTQPKVDNEDARLIRREAKTLIQKYRQKVMPDTY